MRIDVAAQTDRGKRKRKNEDSYGVFREDTPGCRLFREGALLCVADGLGGHTGGEVASKLAVSIMRETIKEPPQGPADGSGQSAPGEGEGDPIPKLREGFQRANQSIYQTNLDLIKKGLPMGTTLLTALITPDRVFVCNVGDSRCYHFREGEIINRTEDHSWVDEQVKQGLMSRVEADTDSRKNVVTRSIGTHPEVDIDCYRWYVKPGDRLLVCTDGLVNMVQDKAIRQEFLRNAGPAETAQRLVSLANANGGKDNITVIVADISPTAHTRLTRRLRSFARRRSAKMLALLLALLYGALTFAGGYFLGRGR